MLEGHVVVLQYVLFWLPMLFQHCNLSVDLEKRIVTDGSVIPVSPNDSEYFSTSICAVCLA